MLEALASSIRLLCSTRRCSEVGSFSTIGGGISKLSWSDIADALNAIVLTDLGSYLDATGTDVARANDNEKSYVTTSGVYTLEKEITFYKIPSGTMKFYFEALVNASGYRNYVQLRRNDTLLYDFGYTSSTTYVSFTSPALSGWADGDRAQIYSDCYAGGSGGKVRNFRLIGTVDLRSKAANTVV
jgi:hypothetical protein